MLRSTAVLDSAGARVKALVVERDAAHDGKSRITRGLAHLHAREAPAQGRIALEHASVLGLGGGSHAGQLAACQGRLELVGDVVGPVAASTEQGVDLVEKQ